MLLRSYTLGIVPVAAILAGFWLDTTRAIAQTTSNFTITYSTEFTFPSLDENLQPEVVDISPLVQALPSEFQAALPADLPSELINPEILDVTVTGESVDSNVPFGLTNFSSNTYGLPLPPQIDPATGQATRQVSIFRADPAALNVNAPTPEFSDVYFGDDTGNKLIGLANDQAIFDFVEGTVEGNGIITIVGGEGIFEGASGRIEFTQQDVLGAPGEASTQGEAKLDFFVQTPGNTESVPEPKADATIAAIGVIGTGFLLHRRRRQARL